MINPIASITIAFGVLLVMIGIGLVIKRRTIVGTAIALFGLVAIAFPFVVTYFLGPKL
ncbi:hypothetical protein ANRL2_03480 [Anaerolineae bacterium]|nr:hypothetical protein ANRL2_03480 [Anaerolineae bacterium]